MSMTLPRFAAALLGVAALISVVPAPAGAVTPPTVTYTMTANWGYGFQAQLAVTAGTAVTSWSLEFDAADQQALTVAAYAGSVQTGWHVTLTNRPFNGSIAAGATINLLVQFTNPALINVPPAGFTFNGQPATYTPQPYIHASVDKPSVPEGGSTPVDLTLSRAPNSTVTFQVGQGSASPVVATPTTLTFTPVNWNVPQTLTLTSPRDADTTNQTAWLGLNYWGGSTPSYAGTWLFATQVDNG
jgi:hypothetical protein